MCYGQQYKSVRLYHLSALLRFHIQMSARFEKFIYSFPIQLTFHHFKKNLALLAVWAIIISAFSGSLGKVYGIHYLFLDPEYLGEVSFTSFFLVGMALGNLTMAFHITVYILDGHRYRFVGRLQKPFLKFSVNNSVVPLIALLVYLILMIRFQVSNELASKVDILLYLLGLITGIIVLMLLMFLYFKFTNKDIFKVVAGNVDMQLRKSQLSRGRMMNKLNENKRLKYRITSYLDLKLKVRSTKDIVGDSNREAVLKVFDQNHFNSVLIELIIIGIIFVLGSFMENPLLQIPAAASSLLIFSIGVMLVGAVSYWFKGWGLAFALGLFVLTNFAIKNGLGKEISQANGLDYDAGNISYTIENLMATHSREQYVRDELHMIEILENWKSKWSDSTRRKMVFLCVSGGGQRAALWTLNSLIHADSILSGELMNYTFLITGASGGIIGAAYYRELFRRNLLYQANSNELLQRMGRDNLNPIIFSLLVNDIFFKYRTYENANKTYSLDRGHTFEQSLNNNLGGILSNRIGDYLVDEETSRIPTLIMSPTIANDGRKLYISAQPVIFMSTSIQGADDPVSKIQRGVDFQVLFKNHSANDLSFLSALRMSASFPYITPTISLPCDPRIEIMDAGISDNFGISDAIRFIYVFRDWINENTNGIIMLVVRDTRSNSPIEGRPVPSVIDQITYPIASVYNNLGNIQDIDNDARLEQAHDWFDGELDVIEIKYDPYWNNLSKSDNERASLSWHLTTREKQSIIDNIYIESNMTSLQKLRALLKSSSTP